MARKPVHKMMMDKLRVVFDCMIFLQAAINEKSPAAELFRQIENQTLQLFVSNEIISEIRNVLSRPKILSKNPHLSDEYVEIFLTRVLKKAVSIKRISPKFKYSRDPKDEKYLNLALEVKADYIVSRDKDLLDLMTDTNVEAKEFRQKSRPLKIVPPIEFLQILAEKD